MNDIPNKNKLLLQFILTILMFSVVTVVATYLFFFLFGIWWLSVAVSIAVQILVHWSARELAYASKVRKSLDSYDKLEYKKYPAHGIECAACKASNDFLLDWNTVGFKCKACGTENGLEIRLNPFVKALDSEVREL